MGYSVDKTNEVLNRLLDSFTILDDPPEARTLWRKLVVTHEVKGVQVHDARLVAAMNARGLTHILTYNGRDFKRYPALTILTPADVLTA